MPLSLESNIWAISDPLADEVWYASIVSMPLYLSAMLFADYLFSKNINWRTLSGFILRAALCEHFQIPSCKQLYQKIFIIIWVAAFYILLQAYAGNLTAILTTPALPNPIKNASEFLNQNEFSLLMRKGSTLEYMLKHSSDEIETKLAERAQSIEPVTPTNDFFEYGCLPPDDYKSGKSAAICGKGGFWRLTSYDFGRTGRCNFYLTNDKFHVVMNTVAAFQVCFYSH